MSLHIHSDYYQDELEIRYCISCMKTFIVGKELTQTADIYCPYCSSKKSEAVAWLDDEASLQELGCAGIYFFKENGEYYDRCVLCRERLTSKNIKHQALCINCAAG